MDVKDRDLATTFLLGTFPLNSECEDEFKMSSEIMYMFLRMRFVVDTILLVVRLISTVIIQVCSFMLTWTKS